MYAGRICKNVVHTYTDKHSYIMFHIIGSQKEFNNTWQDGVSIAAVSDTTNQVTTTMIVSHDNNCRLPCHTSLPIHYTKEKCTTATYTWTLIAYPFDIRAL